MKTKQERTAEQHIISAFNAAIDEMGQDPEIDAIRALYGAAPQSPLDFLITGFCMGFDKGAENAISLLL